MSRAIIVTRQRARLRSRRARILVVVGSLECQRHRPLVSASVPRAFPKEPVRRRRVAYARTVIGLINHITCSWKNHRFVTWRDVFLKFSWWSSIFRRALRRSTARFQPDHHSGRSTADGNSAVPASSTVVTQEATVVSTLTTMMGNQPISQRHPSSVITSAAIKAPRVGSTAAPHRPASVRFGYESSSGWSPAGENKRLLSVQRSACSSRRKKY